MTHCPKIKSVPNMQIVGCPKITSVPTKPLLQGWKTWWHLDLEDTFVGGSLEDVKEAFECKYH